MKSIVSNPVNVPLSMLSLPDGKVVYKLPSQVAVCHDAVIRDVIGGDELEKHLSLSYLHPGLSPAPPSSLLTHLGVKYLRGSDVTTVTTAMARELMEGIHSGVLKGGRRKRIARERNLMESQSMSLQIMAEHNGL